MAKYPYKNEDKRFAEYKTYRQWKEAHHNVKGEAKGVELYAGRGGHDVYTYYSPDEVLPMTGEEIELYEKEKRDRRNVQARERRRREKARKEAEAKEAYEEMLSSWHTSWQWLAWYNRIPKLDAVPVPKAKNSAGENTSTQIM